MIDLSDRQISEYFHRSYTAVDGLWFMKIEEECGFEFALRLDTEVWKVMPKIQARKLKELGGLGNGIRPLEECLTTKLALEGFSFQAQRMKDCFRVVIGRCPWHDIRVRSGRESVSQRVGDVICGAEYAAWAAEFGKDIVFEQKDRICKGDMSCVFRFCRQTRAAAGSTA